jgi:hypothetical protein
VFAEVRKLVKDFCYLDFLYAMPKLRVLLKATILQHTSDSRTRANGYAHTWFDSRAIDLATLSRYPTDLEIHATSATAYDAAESLFVFLDIAPLSSHPYNSNPLPHLPGIGALLTQDDKKWEDEEWDDDNESSDHESSMGDSSQLQHIIDT